MRRPATYLPHLSLLLAAVCAIPLAAQEAAAVPTLEAGTALMAAQDWPGAVRAFRALTAAEPENGAAWFGLGRALYSSRQVDPALEAYARTLELGFQPARTMLHLARCHAVKGEDEAALTWLEKAAATGASIFQALTTIEEFHRFFGNDRFQALVEELRPCGAPEYRQLDFWLGQWQVVGAQGQPLGTNSILKILNGCALIENWKGAGGNEGKSLFYYNAMDKTWKQQWVTDGGQVKEKHLIAALDSGGVRFQGELRRDDGSIILDRTTLVPLEDGRVRQVIEQSADGGETWRAGFDAVYVPAN